MKNFNLLEVSSGNIMSFMDFFSYKANVIIFICNHCPYVKHINKKLIYLSNKYILKKISFLAINSNDIIKYPDDSPENMKIICKKLNYPFPYFFDEEQKVANYYNAKCTPEFFIFSGDSTLLYNGPFDNSRPNNKIPVTGKYITNILENILKGNKYDNPIVIPSIGCSIKWKT